MKQQVWTKIGRIFNVDANSEHMFSHASVPIVRNISNSDVEVYFSTRDKNQQGSVSKLCFDLETLKVKSVSDQPLLEKGLLGCFDDSGVMGSCVVQTNGRELLYYIGWNLGVTVPFRNSIGLAELDLERGIFERKFDGPILDRTKDEPHFCASNCVIFDEGVYKIWYLSCTGWEKLPDGGIQHHYHIKYATSLDGVQWDRDRKVAIDYASPAEYAISVPRVIKEGGIYKMWFSSRGSATSKYYKIRYAESNDGLQWTRYDNAVSLVGHEDSWDSEMQCYPYIFDANGNRYMLYNGNGYGLTGFGIARLER